MAIDLAEADRQKGEFLATLAHELRNPLAPLRSALELLKHSGTDAARAQLARDTMDRQLGQMVRLVDDLLDVNRVMHNRLELRPVDIDIAPVIHQAVEMSQPLIDTAGHHLRVILPAEPLFLHADPVRLTQVFANLLNNSSKYTPAGGQLQISAERDGDHAVVRVKDSGAGIPADQLEKIFNMFNQVDRSPERAQGGLGIGLTLVRRLSEMHGGSVHARSDGPGKGSEFIVRLPALAQAPQTRKSQAPAAAAAAMRRRVLIVDDNRDAADALAMLLRHTGHEAFVAYDGTAAFTAAETHRPDVILLDIGLPGMSGHDVCRQLREQPWGRSIRMIALTGWGQEEDRRKSTEAGFDGHLVKPVDIAAVLEQFQRAPALG
jgi:CheY-like chemotaxis protein